MRSDLIAANTADRDAVLAQIRLAEARRARAFTRLLGCQVAPGHLRALLVAVSDWMCASGDADTDGEGMRALDDGERKIAQYFFDKRDVMERLTQAMADDRELTLLAGSIDPVNGVYELVVDEDMTLDDARAAYAGALQERERAFISHVVARHDGAPSTFTEHRRRGSIARPRVRGHRFRRSSSSGRAGPDDDPGDPEPASPSPRTGRQQTAGAQLVGARS